MKRSLSLVVALILFSGSAAAMQVVPPPAQSTPPIVVPTNLPPEPPVIPAVSVLQLTVPAQAQSPVLQQGRGAGAMQSPLGDVTLRFMLIEASSTATQKDPAIAALERELTSLLKFNGYTLVSQAVISMGVAREVGGFTPRSAASSQYLSGPGGVYELRLTSTSGIQGSGDNASVNMNVDLRYAGGYPSQGLGGINQLLGAQGYGGRAGTAPPSSIASADSPPQPPGRGGRGGRAGTPQGGRAGGAPTPALAMYSRVLSTTVRLVNGRTLILGTTQPAGPGEALILAVIPIIRL